MHQNNLKIIYSILQDIGDERQISFGEFMYFYLILNEISNNARGNAFKSFSNLLDKLSKTHNKIEVNQPHFLWAFMNPDRSKLVKKKTIKDVLKAWCENRVKGRKSLLDSLEEIIWSVETSTESKRSKNYYH